MTLPGLKLRFTYYLRSQSINLDLHSQQALRDLQLQYDLPKDFSQRVQAYLFKKHAQFSVKDLLESFVSEVVSGGGFSCDDENRFYQAAAAIFASPLQSIPDYNLIGLSQSQFDQLDSALFNQDYLKHIAMCRMSKEVVLSGPQLALACQTPTE